MTRLEQIEQLNEILLTEMPNNHREAAAVPRNATAQRRLLRSLMNVRPPLPLYPEYLAAQDALLAAECQEKGVVCVDNLPITQADPSIRKNTLTVLMQLCSGRYLECSYKGW